MDCKFFGPKSFNVLLQKQLRSACSSELPVFHRCHIVCIWRDEIPSGVCHSARVDLLGDDKYLCD